jgi:two-component system phosphate regulon sensor histidine kinase PhoR
MKMKHLSLNLDLKSVIIIIAAGVLLPVMLATATGIVALVVAKDTGTLVTGILVICFAAAAAGSGLVALVLASRKASLARQQADFVANISHELRTPLSAIRLYAQTLQSGKLASDPGKTAQCVSAILRESAWLDLMIERVLSWRASSMEVLKLTMVSQPLTEAVTGAVERFRGMVEDEEVDLSAQIDVHAPVLHDPKAINVVVLNLLTNAYKYTGPDKVVRVCARDENGFSVISVEDNGIGMTSAEERRVFQPFYRGGGSSNETGGIGLGLSIASYIITRHSGELTCSSEKGKGSVFTIRLPHSAEKD